MLCKRTETINVLSRYFNFTAQRYNFLPIRGSYYPHNHHFMPYFFILRYSVDESTLSIWAAFVLTPPHDCKALMMLCFSSSSSFNGSSGASVQIRIVNERIFGHQYRSSNLGLQLPDVTWPGVWEQQPFRFSREARSFPMKLRRIFLAEEVGKREYIFGTFT